MIHHIYIGHSHWTLESPLELEWEEDGRQFTLPNADSRPEATKNFKIIPTVSLPNIGGAVSAETEIRRVYLQEGQEARQYLLAQSKQVYAVSAEMDADNTCIFLDANNPGLFRLDRFFYNYLSPERNLLYDDQIILHSCYIIYQGKAILFTAPSETGKSTQGNHWANLFGADVINGDRSLLAKKDGVWTAYGLPFSGTSGICKNLQAPIGAIIYLHQAPENRASELQGMELFLKLYEQITINNWNAESTAHACDLLEDLIAQVPVYDFYCTKYEEAAEYLKNYLYPDAE